MSKSKISYFMFLIFMVLISASYHFALCLYSAWQKSAWSLSVWWVIFDFNNHFTFYFIFISIIFLFFYQNFKPYLIKYIHYLSFLWKLFNSYTCMLWDYKWRIKYVYFILKYGKCRFGTTTHLTWLYFWKLFYYRVDCIKCNIK